MGTITKLFSVLYEFPNKMCITVFFSLLCSFLEYKIYIQFRNTLTGTTYVLTVGMVMFENRYLGDI